MIGGKSSFQLKNIIEPFSDFYLHNIAFEDLSDSPRFDVEFSLKKEDKKKAPFYETSLKIKAKQLFKKIEEIKLKNEATFGYLILETYPDKVEAEKAVIEKEHNAELSAMDHDRQKQVDLLCWCFTAGALITYFFKLYKL